MKVVFAHDHIFKKDKLENLYTTGSFNNQVWKRYLNHFSEVKVVARLASEQVIDTKKYNDFNLEETSFIPIPSLSGPIAQYKNKGLATSKIRTALEDADALIARLPSEIGNLSIEIAKEMGKPYAIEVVACVWDALWNYGKFQAKLYAPIATQKMKRVVKQAPYAIYVTNDFLQQRYPSEGETQNISNVEIKTVEEESLMRRLKKLETSNQLYRVGMIGNLNNKIKGLEIAIKAFDLLNKEGIDFEFQILGDGDKNQWLKLLDELGIKQKVVFCGALPGGEPVMKWLDNLDLYIQPSFQEGLPRAVIEAMSRACPVVGSTAGGIPELIDKGCLHKPGDYKGLAKVLKNTMFDMNAAKKLAKENFEESKKYKKTILDDKRNIFWSNFKKTI